jgi:site-specific recombinase XerD
MTPDATMLSRRYADLLRANGCSDRTIDNYLYSLSGFCNFLGERSLRETTADDIIAYQVNVAARGLSDSTVRVATYALRTAGAPSARHGGPTAFPPPALPGFIGTTP